MKKLLGKRKGFTLVELIVVIAIIGVLAAILIPTMLGYVTGSRVASANNVADSVKKSINLFLTEANVSDYGMFKSHMSFTEGSASVINGLWTVTITDPSVFISCGNISWSGSGTGRAGQNPVSYSNAEDLLAYRLAKEFPEIDNAYVGFYLKAGTCCAVYATEETSSPIVIQAFGGDGWSSDVYIWDGKTAGINSEGFYVGTAPVLLLG